MRFLLFISFIVLSVSVYAQKTDTIVHTNGNILTGEIKRIDFGIVSFKMDGMGTIKYEMDKVQSIKSDKYFEIKLAHGLYYFGTFDTSRQERKVKIVLVDKTELVDVKSLIEVFPIKQNFWLRVSGKIDMGVDFNKGSGIGTVNFNGNVSYRKRKSFYQFSWANNTIMQKDTVSSAKADVDIEYQRYIKNKWSAKVKSGVNENTELGLNLRLYLTAYGIWDVVHNNRNRLYVGAGLSGNREWSGGDSTANNNSELVITTEYKLYKFTNPEIDIVTDFSVYPSINQNHRLRLEYNLKTKFELFNDFYLGLNYYYSFDSKPITIDASSEDWGITTTIGYSFH